MKTIRIKLKPNGSMAVETHGIKGKQCLQYMDVFSAMLQAKITDSAFTSEYYETEEAGTVRLLEEVEANA